MPKIPPYQEQQEPAPFNPERAMKEGAKTKWGHPVEILSINADLSNGLDIIGVITLPDGERHQDSWTARGNNPGMPTRDLINKPKREIKQWYLDYHGYEDQPFYSIGKNVISLSTHRLEITFEDGEPVSAELVKLAKWTLTTGRGE